MVNETTSRWLTQVGSWEVAFTENIGIQTLYTIIFINGQIKTYFTSFNGFQNVF